MEINNPHFGTINLKPNDMTYMLVTLTLNGRTSPCNLFIGKEVAANPHFIQEAAAWLDKLEHNDRVARAALIASYDSGNQLIEDFIDFHLEEVLELIQKKLEIETINYLCSWKIWIYVAWECILVMEIFSSIVIIPLGKNLLMNFWL